MQDCFSGNHKQDRGFDTVMKIGHYHLFIIVFSPQDYGSKYLVTSISFCSSLFELLFFTMMHALL